MDIWSRELHAKVTDGPGAEYIYISDRHTLPYRWPPQAIVLLVGAHTFAAKITSRQNVVCVMRFFVRPIVRFVFLLAGKANSNDWFWMMLSHTHTHVHCAFCTRRSNGQAPWYTRASLYAQLWLEVHFDISVPSRVSVVDESVNKRTKRRWRSRSISHDHRCECNWNYSYRLLYNNNIRILV